MRCDKCKKDFDSTEIKQSKQGAFSPLRYYCDYCYEKNLFYSRMGNFIFFLVFIIFIIVVIVIV